MAFKTPPPEAIAWAEPDIPGGVGRLIQQHDTAVKSLIEAAEAANGEVDTAATLAAIKAYREAMMGTDDKPGARTVVRRIARYLIAAGLPPGRVCRGLGFGRTWMNRYMSEDPMFARLIEPGKKSVKKVA